MPTLYHFALSPVCRKVRVVAAEKRLELALIDEPVWQRRRDFLALNPAGDVPVLTFEGGPTLADSGAICEYLEEVHPDPTLIGDTPGQRAEVRRLVAWFDRKFNAEVTLNLVHEKIVKRLSGVGGPDSAAIRAGLTNVRHHLDYIGFLIDRRSWLAGPTLSLADIAAASHLSCVDYLGNVPWDVNETARDWYARIKSRPSFRPLLADRVPGMPPPTAYADLDF